MIPNFSEMDFGFFREIIFYNSWLKRRNATLTKISKRYASRRFKWNNVAIFGILLSMQTHGPWLLDPMIHPCLSNVQLSVRGLVGWLDRNAFVKINEMTLRLGYFVRDCGSSCNSQTQCNPFLRLQKRCIRNKSVIDQDLCLHSRAYLVRSWK